MIGHTGQPELISDLLSLIEIKIGLLYGILPSQLGTFETLLDNKLSETKYSVITDDKGQFTIYCRTLIN